MRKDYELIQQCYNNKCKVIVSRGRDFTNYALMSTNLDKFFLEQKFLENPPKIISGMAKGVDTLAIQYADERKLTKILFPANWKKYSLLAGFLRNEDMLSIATHLVAF